MEKIMEQIYQNWQGIVTVLYLFALFIFFPIFVVLHECITIHRKKQENSDDHN